MTGAAAGGGRCEIRVEGAAVELGGQEVLHGIDATFAAGRLTAVVGPNGAGKSTLVRAALGILPLSRGRVTIGGRDLRGLHRREVARASAFVPQDTHIEFAFTVEEVVAMGRSPWLDPLAREGPADRDAVRRALEILELVELRWRRVTDLSGGERQRVLIARALATEAPALVLDEPISNLDIGHRLDILELLRAQAASGKAVVAVLHDLELALRTCDPVLVLAEGRAAAFGRPDEVLASGVIEEAFGVAVETIQSADAPGGPTVKFHRRLRKDQRGPGA